MAPADVVVDHLAPQAFIGAIDAVDRQPKVMAQLSIGGILPVARGLAVGPRLSYLWRINPPAPDRSRWDDRPRLVKLELEFRFR